MTDIKLLRSPFLCLLLERSWSHWGGNPDSEKQIFFKSATRIAIHYFLEIIQKLAVLKKVFLQSVS